MKRPNLLRRMLVTDGRGDSRRILRVVRQAYGAGVRAFQVRERAMDDKSLLALLRGLRSILPRGKALLLVNDRVDLCLASGADGVQLGFRSVPAASARELLGRNRCIGVSIHQPKESLRASREGADFVLFGPVFSTPSKRGILPPAGLGSLERTVRISSIPVLAIGGIGAHNAARVLRSGCAGLACVREIFGATRVASRAKHFVEASAP